MAEKRKVTQPDQSLTDDRYNQRAPDLESLPKPARWTSLDIARGFAIILMILSHCVKGLMVHSLIPDWGVVPIHLITKFSSSLFILVFGVSVSLYFIPHIGTQRWKKKRLWMIKRGIELMVWYKILTVVQMFQFYPQSMIVDTLLFRSMPDFVEILCFYSIALLWLPLFLPLWTRMHGLVKILFTLGLFFSGHWLHYNFDFWNYDVLKALLVEQEGFYTFGQFQRGALIFFGLSIGDLYKHFNSGNYSKNPVPQYCIALGLIGLSSFYFLNSQDLMKRLYDIANNVGKHPFDAHFLSFSLGGALLVLGLSLLMGASVRRVLKPISYIGQHSLNAFILHIIIIFYFYRYYFDLHHKVTYLQSLGLTGICVIGIITSMYFWNKTKTVFA